MNVVQLLVRAARTFPERPALLLGDTVRFDYATLGERCARIATWLRRQRGCTPGARVALWLGNDIAYLEVLNACWWAGLAAVPINGKLHPREVAWIVADCGASLLWTSEGQVQALREALAETGSDCEVLAVHGASHAAALACEPMPPTHCAPEALAWLFYTSGTTGRPKGVMLTHRNLLAMTACYFSDVDSIEAEDAIVYAAPMSHGAGLYSLAFMARAARHVVPRSGGFDAAELTGLAANVGRLCLFAAPTIVKRIVDHVIASGASVAGFKTIVYGGGPMYVEDIQRALDAMGPRFVQIYGQGESPMTITALSRETLAEREHPQWLARIASVGVAQSLVEVRVVDEAGREVPCGTVGEVTVRGDTVMAGYWNNPQASASALRDGWLWTGDLGVMDVAGFVTLKDRSKDVIISGGSNIYPREVEEVLLTHSAVREVAVVGQRDAEWGEVVVAYVVAEGVDAHSLDLHCVEHIARFKRPKHYRFVASLPKNHYGKVLKTELRERLRD